MDICAAFLKCKLFTILTTINTTHVQTKPFSEKVMVVNEWKKKPKPKYSHTFAKVVELNTCVTGKIITQTSILFHLKPISKPEQKCSVAETKSKTNQQKETPPNQQLS